jgi:hypothetical protein
MPITLEQGQKSARITSAVHDMPIAVLRRGDEVATVVGNEARRTLLRDGWIVIDVVRAGSPPLAVDVLHEVVEKARTFRGIDGSAIQHAISHAGRMDAAAHAAPESIDRAVDARAAWVQIAALALAGAGGWDINLAARQSATTTAPVIPG